MQYGRQPDYYSAVVDKGSVVNVINEEVTRYVEEYKNNECQSHVRRGTSLQTLVKP